MKNLLAFVVLCASMTSLMGMDDIKKNILYGHRDIVTCVVFSPDETYIISGCEGKEPILWDGRTGEIIRILEGHERHVGSVAFSPDGRYIVSGASGHENNLILWDVREIER